MPATAAEEVKRNDIRIGNAVDDLVSNLKTRKRSF